MTEMDDKYLKAAVVQLRTRGGFDETPDEMIAQTFAARMLALDLAAAELPPAATRRFRRARAAFERRQRERLDDFVRRHLSS